MKSNLAERQVQAMADQLLIDERQELIYQAARLRGEQNTHGFTMDWYDDTVDTSYKMRGVILPASALVSYAFTLQHGEDDPSRLTFNEHQIGIRVYGPLNYALREHSFEQAQLYLGSVVHQALGNLIADSYSVIS